MTPAREELHLTIKTAVYRAQEVVSFPQKREVAHGWSTLFTLIPVGAHRGRGHRT
jgi:hypothetical protein